MRLAGFYLLVTTLCAAAFTVTAAGSGDSAPVEMKGVIKESVNIWDPVKAREKALNIVKSLESRITRQHRIKELKEWVESQKWLQEHPRNV